ncbi:hypothetical protein ACFXG4_27245 [Nocardia sp. NPDC059246]|uniref:hypothetical protein n=1 Tax=unclassified Nocardia TaxID=2637762 RepID=UPI0036CB65AE
MRNPLSLAVVDGTVTFTDAYGYTHTATGIDLQPGDVVSAQMGGDGLWFVVERDGETQRHPLRRDGAPHFTELKSTWVWANPFLPDAGSRLSV